MATLQSYPVGKKNSSKSLYLVQFLRYKHFCVLQFLRKIRQFKLSAIFGETKFFLKIEMATLKRYPVGKKFRQNCSILHGFRDISIIFSETKFFWKLWWLLCTDSLGVKNFIEIVLSCTVFKIQPFLCFANFAKKSKIQNVRHFWWDKIFLKIGMATLQGYPVDQKFRRNHSIATVFEIQAFLCFPYLENS